MAYMATLPGKKLLFMGTEFGQWREWDHESSLDWHLLNYPEHGGLMACVRDLNRLYRETPALHATDTDPAGFEWIDANDSEQSTLSYLRKGPAGELVVVALNFTPVPRPNFRIGVPEPGFYAEVLNTDAPIYGGSGQGNLGGVESVPVGAHGRLHSLLITLPPLAAVIFKLRR
jgi:1,4-alpha-glucan branching enzyme